MLNPFGPQREPSLFSFIGLEKRMLKRVQSAKINDQIFQAVQNAFEDALKQEGIILSRPEKIALLSRILERVLSDMIKKLKKDSV